MANLASANRLRPSMLTSLAVALIILVSLLCQAAYSQGNRVEPSQPSVFQTSWDELKSKAESLYRAGKYDEAIRRTELLKLLAEKTYGPHSLRMAEALGNLGALYRLVGRGKEGIALIKKARHIRDVHGVKGIPLGIQSEVFFNLVAKRRRSIVRQ